MKGNFNQQAKKETLSPSEYDAQPLIRSGLYLKQVENIDEIYKKDKVLGHGGYSTVY